jgi:hypothetical protein
MGDFFLAQMGDASAKALCLDVGPAEREWGIAGSVLPHFPRRSVHKARGRCKGFSAQTDTARDRQEILQTKVGARTRPPPMSPSPGPVLAFWFRAMLRFWCRLAIVCCVMWSRRCCAHGPRRAGMSRGATCTALWMN